MMILGADYRLIKNYFCAVLHNTMLWPQETPFWCLPHIAAPNVQLFWCGKLNKMALLLQHMHFYLICF